MAYQRVKHDGIKFSIVRGRSMATPDSELHTVGKPLFCRKIASYRSEVRAQIDCYDFAAKTGTTQDTWASHASAAAEVKHAGGLVNPHCIEIFMHHFGKDRMLPTCFQSFNQDI
jgi:hypothetical protein